MVVFPRTTEEVSAIVKITAEHGVSIVGRGAGTGLSGGAIPRAGGVMIGFARMNRILEIDIENERAVLQPGVVNLDITLAVQAARLLLRARPFQPARLHHRRQRGGELRRPAHAGLRCHHEPRPRPRIRDARRHHPHHRRQGAGSARLRSHRPADRLRRHHGAGHEDHRAAHAPAREESRPSSPSTTPRPMRPTQSPRSPPAPSRP